METLSKQQVLAFHDLFEVPYDLMSHSKREAAIRDQSSLDLQLLGGRDMVACLLDIVMYVKSHA